MDLNSVPSDATWHYIDLPADMEKPSIDDFCKNDNCVVGAVKRFKDILANPHASDLERRDSLSESRARLLSLPTPH